MIHLPPKLSRLTLSSPLSVCLSGGKLHMELKLYVDRLSPPSRAVLIFCKANGIQFEEVKIKLAKRQQLSPEYAEINPLRKIPVIVHGHFKLFESHAILTYLASTFPGVADHWYPRDVCQRARIHSVLDWHLPTLGLGTYDYIVNTVFSVALGIRSNPNAARRGEKLVTSALATIESVWLEGDGNFLLGNSLPSIADLCLACEVMMLEVIDERDRERILGPHKRLLKWIENTRKASAPHFDEIHSALLPLKEKVKKLRSNL